MEVYIWKKVIISEYYFEIYSVEIRTFEEEFNSFESKKSLEFFYFEIRRIIFNIASRITVLREVEK